MRTPTFQSRSKTACFLGFDTYRLSIPSVPRKITHFVVLTYVTSFEHVTFYLYAQAYVSQALFDPELRGEETLSPSQY